MEARFFLLQTHTHKENTMQKRLPPPSRKKEETRAGNGRQPEGGARARARPRP